jgi:hypothetical protein
MGVTLAMKTNIPVDDRQSLSMLRTLGAMLANGARADARDRRRQLERVAGICAGGGNSNRSELAGR